MLSFPDLVDSYLLAVVNYQFFPSGRWQCRWYRRCVGGGPKKFILLVFVDILKFDFREGSDSGQQNGDHQEAETLSQANCELITLIIVLVLCRGYNRFYRGRG